MKFQSLLLVPACAVAIVAEPLPAGHPGVDANKRGQKVPEAPLPQAY